MASNVTATTAQSFAGKMASQPSSWLRPAYALWAFIGLMYLYVLLHNESFLINRNNPEWEHIQSFKWWLLPHGVAGACALFLAPLQFSDSLRKRFIQLHRVMGRIYVGAVFVAAPIGLYIQYLEERLGIPRSFTIATAVDGGLWLLSTGVAMAFILKGKVPQHRQWMTRSFACALIFLEVRFIDGITGRENLGLAAVETTLWICVACAIPLADSVLQWQDSRRARPIPVRAQGARP